MSPAGFTARILAVPVRLLFPEALVLAALLALPWLPGVFRFIEPRAHLLLAAVVVAGVGIGWRFARGRVIHGLLVLLVAATLPLFPEDSTTGALAALLVPLNLAAIALLPDRGILTRGGLLRTAVLLLQAAVVAAAGRLPADAFPSPLADITLPPFGTTVDGPLVVYGMALSTLLALAVATRGAPARGALWATAGALAAEAGYPGGATYVLAAAGLTLVVAALEDAYALAYRDALTGLPSRRALDELLARTARGYTLAMVDVDHFKAFNDRHGHDVGDQVLRMVASHLRHTGGGARAFRYGGEEFTLVFRGRRLEDASPHLDRVREAIEAAEFGIRGPGRPKKKPRKVLPGRRKHRTLSVTVSIGAAERNGRGSPAEVLKAADAALYRAKEAGRNRVVSGRT